MKVFLNLKSLRAIESDNRNSCIDIFRGVAIISVVLFHFNGSLPYGYLGVDLFFVISGLLIGGILTKKIDHGQPINFLSFVLQRGFKIWPSYYTFLILGNIIAYFAYRSLAQDQFIPLWDIKRYLFFYQNYTGLPFHWSFDHVWSLCVEEHFYILLPILFIVAQRLFKSKTLLVWSVVAVIGAGILFKYLALIYTRSKDTYSATHNRIDALAWGVLLSLIIIYYPHLLKKSRPIYIFFYGFSLFIITLIVEINSTSILFHKVLLHSIIPFCFFLMIAGAYYYDLSKLKYLRLIAYYSYNWYLWHPLFAIGVTHLFGNTIIGLIIYLTFTFIVGVIFTVLVEEPFLAIRKSKFDTPDSVI